MCCRQFLSLFVSNFFILVALGFCEHLFAQAPDLTWMDRLPVIELRYDVSQFNTDSFIPASYTYHSSDSICQFSCSIRHRGGSSVVFAKPSYAIKFCDEQGESMDVSFLDMRSDNYWILDAAAGDQSKMRNRASMDLWLDFSHKPYHQSKEKKAINGVRGRFVEVYVNDAYAGLYCLSERVDRKQLKLKKFKTDESTGEPYFRGLLYKAVSNTDTRTPFFYYNKEVPSSDDLMEWDGMKNEYPDVRDHEPWSWTPLLTAVKKVALNSSSFRTNVETYFDLPVFFDYVLFIDLMCALDNVGKNYYCWFYDYTSDDKRLGYTPWDMDATWGRDWAGEPMDASRVMNSRSNFHTRMLSSYKGYADSLNMRYAELRRSYWAEESLYSYFDRYFQLFDETGAMNREYERWKNSNCRIRSVEAEKQFIHQWIHDRLAYMDEEYGFDPAFINQPSAEFLPADSEIRYNLFGQPLSSEKSGWNIHFGRLIFIHP